MKLKLNILLLSSLLLSSSLTHAAASSDTDNYIAALTQLLEQKTISDAELVTMLEAAEDGKIVNPISPVRAETSVEHFVASNALEELLHGKIDASRVAVWTKENIKEQDRVRKKRKKVENATKELWEESSAEFFSWRWGHGCAVTIDGTLKCWGSKTSGESTPPFGIYQSVSTGYEHSCGVRIDGVIRCWGGNTHGQAISQSAIFQSVSTGRYNTYGLRVDGAIQCWGAACDEPSGVFQSVSTGTYHTCGVKHDGTIQCWGIGDYGNKISPFCPSGFFKSVSVSVDDDFKCGVRVGGAIECWGRSSHPSPSGKFKSATVGMSHACGMKLDGTVTCWGNNHIGQSVAPKGTFHSVSAGSFFTCGVRVGGTIECWGGNTQESAPNGLVVLTRKTNEIPKLYLYYYTVASMIQRFRGPLISEAPKYLHLATSNIVALLSAFLTPVGFGSALADDQVMRE